MENDAKKQPKDYVIATGKQHSIKFFTNLVARTLNLKISWKGKGINECGYLNNKRTIIIDKNILDQQKLSLY